MPVLNITQADHFENFVNTHNNVLCLYYWKLCGYCQSFAPIWKSVIQHYADKVNIINVELDCIRNLDKKYQVSVFPTIMIIKNGKQSTVLKNDMRNPKNLQTFIEKNMLQHKKVQKPKKIKK
jgi:thiol-disulfide isomerase/thioredoxin